MEDITLRRTFLVALIMSQKVLFRILGRLAEWKQINPPYEQIETDYGDENIDNQDQYKLYRLSGIAICKKDEFIVKCAVVVNSGQYRSAALAIKIGSKAENGSVTYKKIRLFEYGGLSEWSSYFCFWRRPSEKVITELNVDKMILRAWLFRIMIDPEDSKKLNQNLHRIRMNKSHRTQKKNKTKYSLIAAA